MALIDDFKTRFPTFTAATVDATFPQIETVWPCYFGGAYESDCNKEIILNLLAHLFVDETNSGTASVKSVDSKSVGSVSVSYSASTSSGGEGYDFFKTTKYGKRFWMMTRSNMGAFFV